jgi:hypothetical protein
MSIYLFQSFYFYLLLSLSPYVTLFVIVFSTFIHSFSLCVSLTSIDSKSPSFFVYPTFLSPFHVHSPLMFVFSFSLFVNF